MVARIASASHPLRMTTCGGKKIDGHGSERRRQLVEILSSNTVPQCVEEELTYCRCSAPPAHDAALQPEPRRDG